MTSDRALFALADSPIAGALTEAAQALKPPLNPKFLAAGEDLAEALLGGDFGLLVCSARVDESGDLGRLRAAQKNGPLPPTVVLFEEASDPRRRMAAELGLREHVLPPSGDLNSLLLLIARLQDRRDVQTQLEASLRRFQALVEKSSDAIYILQGGDIAYVNDRFSQLVGFSPEELLKPGFSIEDNLVAPESRRIVAERGERVEAREAVEPVYEFIAQRKDGSTFNAHVSISYIDLEGEPAAMGIVTDVTERIRFEKQLLRKNRQLELFNAIAASMNQAVHLNATLRMGSERIRELFGVDAVGISLLSTDGKHLLLRAHEGMEDPLVSSLSQMKATEKSLLGEAIATGEVVVSTNLQTDSRVAVDAVRGSGFTTCTIVPLKAKNRTLGAAFTFTQAENPPSESEREFLLSIGLLLGTAIEKASLFEKERAAVRRLTALDEVASAVASTLDMSQIAQTTARSVRRLFDAQQVLLAQHRPDTETFVPLLRLTQTDVQADPAPIAREDTLMGLALELQRPVQRAVNPTGGQKADDDRPPPLPEHEAALGAEGISSVVAVPVISDRAPVGAILLGFRAERTLDDDELEALVALANHVAIALRNASLFGEREKALQDLKEAQDRLVESERLHALGELAAGVAHDFNNMLSAILGRAQLLRRQLPNPALVKHVDVIERAASDGAETVRRIQELGRQEDVDDEQVVDLDEVLEEVLEFTRPKWTGGADPDHPLVRVTTEHLGEVPALVLGRPHEIREVLVNLVHNAVDAMPEGGALSLSADTCTRQGRELCQITVQDTGTGIPEEVRKNIFDPFFTTKGSRGTGLGLSVSFSIIKRHGGEVEVTSQTTGPQRGTRFVLTFPRHIAAEGAPTATQKMERSDDPPARAARILVIDDEENVREILSDLLLSEGHEVTACDNGPSGLTALESALFDMVFTDLGLPGMDGYEVCEAIKAKKPDLPVCLLSGWGATLDHDKAKAHGIDLILHKPFRMEEVLQTVEDALAGRIVSQISAATP
jgi:PAS domain S-box-containing protein